MVDFLRRLDEQLGCPVHVVLGNHDFYGGGIGTVRQSVDELSRQRETLCFLTTAANPVELTAKVALIGHDGWADGREGDYNSSLVMMNDYRLIEELARFTKHDRLAELYRLGDEAANHVRRQLELALPEYEEVIVLTHVPPFRGACWYQGTISDDEWAPHFVCQAMGHVILDQAALHPARRITVLCGHTHSPGMFQPANNVNVITGGAEYGAPGITQVFDLL